MNKAQAWPHNVRDTEYLGDAVMEFKLLDLVE